MHDPHDLDPKSAEPTASSPANGEAFIERWSRRKSQLRQGLGVEPEPVAVAVDSAAPAEKSLQPQAPAELTDADMPALETLHEHSDYSGFLSPKVTEHLRRRALHKLFHLPGFNIRDGLDDYDEDFTVFEPLGDVVTADMRHRMEGEAARAKEALQQEVAGGNEPSEPGQEGTGEQAQAEQGTQTQQAREPRPGGEAEQGHEA